ncbi:MAG: hypothetical protein Tsb0021_17450 [Chlamydiales bacterium]
MTVDLIDLWDQSVKVVKLSHLFGSEMDEVFEKRVEAFWKFANHANHSGVLNIPEEEMNSLLLGIKSWKSSQEGEFQLESWLYPVSRGQLAALTNPDHKLTVIHQNLLQAASCGRQEQLPSLLARFYSYFKMWNYTSAKRFTEDTGTFISINEHQASIKHNIPLNFHSTVVSLSQKRGENRVLIDACFRGSDNNRGGHLNFFRLFSALTKIPMTDSQTINNSLKVSFSVQTDDEVHLVSYAIDLLNNFSLNNLDEIKALQNVLNVLVKKSKKEAIDAIYDAVWRHLRETGELLYLGKDLSKKIWKYVKKHGFENSLIERVKQEISGYRTETDFFKRFAKKVLNKLPEEEWSPLLWKDLTGLQKIDVFHLPEEIADKLLPRLFDEYPKKAADFYIMGYPKIYPKLMNQKLQKNELKSKDEIYLLIMLILKGKPNSAIPSIWLEALKKWNQDEVEQLFGEAKEDLTINKENIGKMEAALLHIK